MNYTVNIKYVRASFLQMLQWLEKNIGEQLIDWTYSTNIFSFRYEEDKVKFILKWI